MIHTCQAAKTRLAIATVAALASLAAPPVPAHAQHPASAPSTAPVPTLVAPGAVAAFFSTDLYAKESGYVSDVKADIGDHVKKGDVLAIIDAPELAQRLASAQATLSAKEASAKAGEAAVRQAKAALDVAQRQLAAYETDRTLWQATLKRQEALFADKAATGQQLDEIRAKAQGAEAAADVGKAKIASAEADLLAAEANRAVAEAQVLVASAEVQEATTLLAYTKILAPFDSVVTKRLVNPGDLVQAASTSRTTPLFTCQKIDVVRVFCEVPEASVSGVRPGVKADVRLFGSQGFTQSGTVTRIANSMDPASRTMRAEIDLPNPDEALRPGMYAQVTLTPDAPAPRVVDVAPQR